MMDDLLAEMNEFLPPLSETEQEKENDENWHKLGGICQGSAKCDYVGSEDS